MSLHSLLKKQDLYVVSVIGEDKVGIVSKVTQFLFKKGVNIIDIEQTVVHSQFTMVLLIQPLRSQFPWSEIRRGLSRIAEKLEMKITMTPLREFKGLKLAEAKRPYVLTILGTDRAGVVAGFSSVLAKHHCNIDRIKMIARGDFLGMEMWVELREAHFPLLRQDLNETAKRVGMDIIAQPESIFKKRRKVIIFDMDSTIFDGGQTGEMATMAGVSKKVAANTEKSMGGGSGFLKSPRQRGSPWKRFRIKSL